MLRWLLLASVVAGCSAGAPASATPGPTPVTVSGSGTSSSGPFHLDGGTYRLEITASPSDSAGCFVGGFLADASGKHVAQTGSAQSDTASPASGSGYAYNVVAGAYHVDMDAGCAWSVTVTRQP